jgi:integrase
MASVYKKGNYYYVSWYDALKGKNINRSSKLAVTKENKKIAEKYARDLQQRLDEEVEKCNQIGLKRITIKSAFEHFLKNNSDKHPKTQRDYNRFYKKFVETFDENGQCTQIDKLSSELWLSEIKLLPLQKNSIFDYYKQFNHFLNFLFEYNYLPMFKINRDIKPKREIKEKITFKDEDLRKIFSHLGDKSDSFKLLTYLAAFTGLRSSDLLTIEAKRINLSEREIMYYSPKRKTWRTIGFHKALLPILRRQIEIDPEGKVLPFTLIESVNRAFTRYFQAIGISGKRYTARTFRKTFITLCSKSNITPAVIRELVGHEHTNTTDRYYKDISVEDMLNELEKFRLPEILAGIIDEH